MILQTWPHIRLVTVPRAWAREDSVLSLLPHVGSRQFSQPVRCATTHNSTGGAGHFAPAPHLVYLYRRDAADRPDLAVN